MRKVPLKVLLGLVLTALAVTRGDSQNGTYRLAFAHFGPAATDIYLADGDGSNPRAFLPHDALDYNASLSSDGE